MRKIPRNCLVYDDDACKLKLSEMIGPDPDAARRSDVGDG